MTTSLLELLIAVKNNLKENNFGPKQISGLKKLQGPENIMVPKNSDSQQKFVSKKILWTKKLWAQKNFGSKHVFCPTKFWVQQNVESKKVLCPKKIWIKQILGQNCRSEKIAGSKQILGLRRNWVQEKFWPTYQILATWYDQYRSKSFWWWMLMVVLVGSSGQGCSKKQKC